ncbi:hypothetical protein CHLRE_17g718750v5 [Chlamydomonas reinhardtii]|uniref:Uncharacterized protein n=1 Tax=Chlamydomonas reinhardtii TaxID=3055 RepID=A0A2K3CQ70_CHLRE|nr:uncharacterized protein CHLRE_17g718750v5 [Chlamydomonas reinhardtii]PNW70413.1 hypothetical protein CHLRE_17g718750v5 [Chlamydomonas reinhardtii]
MDRQEALRDIFRLIDVNGNGQIELKELKALATDPTAQGKLLEANDTLTWLDLDGDRQVSEEEFMQVFDFVGTDMSDREFELLLEDMRAQAASAGVGAALSREALLKRVFQALDKDNSGYIEMHELKTLVGQVAPAESLERAHGTLRMFDTNEDGRVSADEFLGVFEFLGQDMDDAEFQGLLSRLQEKGFEALYEGDYTHPHSCRAWLAGEVVPTLREGLLALLKEVEKNKLDLATGVPWDGGAHMPRGWRPFSPLRWLSEWLVRAATAPPPGSVPEGGGLDGLDAFGLAQHISLESMNRAEKIAYVFSQIDAGNAGYILADHLVHTVQLIFADGAAGVTDAHSIIDPVLATMGINPVDSTIDKDEFEQAITQMTSMLSEEEFDEAARVVVAQRDWRYCRSRPDKFRYLFRSLDLDHSNQLNLNELKVLAQRMDPDTNEETIAATLEFLDKDGSEQVSAEEFVEAMSSLLAHIDADAELDDMVQRMLHMRSDADPAHEVEPAQLADFVRGLRTHIAAAQLPTSTIMDKLAGRQPLVLLDVRPDEERLVSVMPGATHVTLTPAPAATWGYVLTGGAPAAAAVVREALATATATALPTAAPPVVACYCSTGELGGVAALLLSDALRITVYNVCGGIINYYNQGGSVCRLGDGKQVQALHPGSQQQRAFITRPNNFR